MLCLRPTFGETAPWQDGVILSVEISPAYTDVAVAVSDTVYVCRPFDTSALGAVHRALDSLNRGLEGKDAIKYYYVGVNARDVRAGARAQMAFFSNGTAKLLSAGGQQFACEIISQRYYPSETKSETNAVQTQAPAPTTSLPPTVDQKNEFPWKLVDDPNLRWKFTIRDQFVFGELASPPERQQLGDFFTLDAKKQGEGFVGTARLRETVSVEAGSTKTCERTLTVELTSVSPDRIEGKFSNEKDQAGCPKVGENWGAVWIRE
jgi:hypothetical protein